MIARAARSLLAAYASLVFASSPVVGAFVLAASFVMPVAGLVGVAAFLGGHLVASALGYRSDAIESGYYGYSALLVGLALGHAFAVDARLLVTAVLGGALAAVATAVLGDLLHRGAGLPVLALPFVLVTTLVVPALFHMPVASTARFAVAPAVVLPAILDLPLRALGAIVFSPTPLAGALVLAGLLVSSRIATALALVGIATAVAVAWAIDDRAAMLAMSYNGALTALAIGGACFVPGRAALVAAILVAAVAAWFAAAMHQPLAWPFTVASLVAIRGLHLRAPDRAPFAALLPGQSPERNVELAASRERFGLPGPPQLALPFFGTWAVTQGTDGAHTHQGPWADALDFEVLDDDGFPFRGDGLRLEDYRCFAMPVLAPVSGIVVAVHDGVADSTPGEVDTARPWGNAVVISFGHELYCVVAHLKCGSVRVVAGQAVTAGQPIAACGASGRSPRPHLHLQVQRSAALGSAAIPFRLVHYVIESAGTRRYIAVGMPSELERIARPATSPLVEAFAALPVGGELRFALEPRGELRTRSEIGLHGERYLHDLDRGDRLYFTSHEGSVVFTSHVGGSDTPLRALFYALPRLPSVAGPIQLVDHPPASALLGWPARTLHEVARVIGDPVEARADIAMREDPRGITVTTSIGVGLRGHVRPRYRGKVELDHAGLRALEVIDERRGGAVLLRARRAA